MCTLRARRLQLEGADAGKQRLESVALRQLLQVAVAANVLAANVDVGHGALAGHGLEGVLKLAAIVCGAGEKRLAGVTHSPTQLCPSRLTQQR